MTVPKANEGAETGSSHVAGGDIKRTVTPKEAPAVCPKHTYRRPTNCTHGHSAGRDESRVHVSPCPFLSEQPDQDVQSPGEAQLSFPRPMVTHTVVPRTTQNKGMSHCRTQGTTGRNPRNHSACTKPQSKPPECTIPFTEASQKDTSAGRSTDAGLSGIRDRATGGLGCGRKQAAGGLPVLCVEYGAGCSNRHTG